MLIIKAENTGDRITITKTRITHYEKYDKPCSSYINLVDLDVVTSYYTLQINWLYPELRSEYGQLPHTITVQTDERRIGCSVFSQKDWNKIVRAVRAAKKEKKPKVRKAAA